MKKILFGGMLFITLLTLTGCGGGGGGGDVGSPPQTGTPVMPTAANTGVPSGTVLTDFSGVITANTTYTGMRITITQPAGMFTFPSGVKFIDCEIRCNSNNNCFLIGTAIEFTRCTIYCELCPNEFSGGGKILNCYITPGSAQGFRPAPNTYGQNVDIPWLLQDSFLETVGSLAGQHLEAMQSLNVNKLTFRNVRFEHSGIGSTGDINHWGNDGEFTDCWFTGPGVDYYHVYTAGTNNVFTRCHFYEDETPFYPKDPSDPKPVINGDMYWYPSGAVIPANQLFT